LHYLFVLVIYLIFVLFIQFIIVVFCLDGFQEQFSALANARGTVDSALLSETLSFAHTITQEEAEHLGIADFPLANMHLLIGLMVSSSTHRLDGRSIYSSAS